MGWLSNTVQHNIAGLTKFAQEHPEMRNTGIGINKKGQVLLFRLNSIHLLDDYAAGNKQRLITSVTDSHLGSPKKRVQILREGVRFCENYGLVSAQGRTRGMHDNVTVGDLIDAQKARATANTQTVGESMLEKAKPGWSLKSEEKMKATLQKPAQEPRKTRLMPKEPAIEQLFDKVEQTRQDTIEKMSKLDEETIEQSITQIKHIWKSTIEEVERISRSKKSNAANSTHGRIWKVNHQMGLNHLQIEMQQLEKSLEKEIKHEPDFIYQDQLNKLSKKSEEVYLFELSNRQH